MDVSVLDDQQNVHQLFTDIGYNLEGMAEEMDDRDGWWEIELENTVLLVGLDDDDDDDDSYLKHYGKQICYKITESFIDI